MRIVLVHPAGSNWVPGKKDMTTVANRMVPLGMLSLSAYLQRAGHQVFLQDCLGPRGPTSPEANVKAILNQRPELVGFSTTTSSFLDGDALAARIKQSAPHVKTVFGGVHASALGAELLAGFKDIDFLCEGEGEGTLSDLADGTDLRSIGGLVWRDGDQVVTNPARPPLPNLDDLPFPDYYGLQGFPRRYHLPLFSYIREPGATMVTSRGCLYQCSFCDRSVFKRSYRYNSAEYIYEHMRYLRGYFDIRHINIYDDLFTAHRSRIEHLCDLLASRPLGLQFNCAVRVGHTDDDLLKNLKRAGCLMVSLGIESADPDLLRRHKSGVDLNAAKETVARIQAVGLRVKGLFIMGLPGETEATIRRTSDFIMSLDLDDMNMAKFTPFPGSPIWATIREEGLLINDWRLMNCLNFVFLPAGISSRERLDELYNRHVKRFYTDRRWRRKAARRLWEHRWSLWRLLTDWPSFRAIRRHFEPQRVDAPPWRHSKRT